MKKTFLAATTAIMALSAVSNANAEERFPRWYVGLAGGLTYQEDSDFTTSAGATGTFNNDEGYAITGSLGYRPVGGFLDKSRMEIALSQSESGISGGGDITVEGVAANYLVDIPMQGSSLVPYLGGGLGYAEFEVEPTNAAGANGTDEEFFYQLMAGVGYVPDNISNVMFEFGYRYFAPFSDPKVDNPGAGTTTEFEYDSHNLELGVQFMF